MGRISLRLLPVLAAVAVGVVAALPTAVEGGLIYLRNGRVLEATVWWEEGDLLFYERTCGRLGIPREVVLRIEGTPGRRAETRCPAAAPAPAPEPRPAEAPSPSAPGPMAAPAPRPAELSAPVLNAPVLSPADCARYRGLPGSARDALFGSALQQGCDPSASDPGSRPDPVYIMKVDGQFTGRTAFWWRYAWMLELRNATADPVRVMAVIEFQDADGSMILQDPRYGLLVRAGAYQTFTGQALIPPPDAARVSRVTARVWVEP
jgi:hypothetical protein